LKNAVANQHRMVFPVHKQGQTHSHFGLYFHTGACPLWVQFTPPLQLQV